MWTLVKREGGKPPQWSPSAQRRRWRAVMSCLALMKTIAMAVRIGTQTSGRGSWIVLQRQGKAHLRGVEAPHPLLVGVWQPFEGCSSHWRPGKRHLPAAPAPAVAPCTGTCGCRGPLPCLWRVWSLSPCQSSCRRTRHGDCGARCRVDQGGVSAAPFPVYQLLLPQAHQPVCKQPYPPMRVWCRMCWGLRRPRHPCSRPHLALAARQSWA